MLAFAAILLLLTILFAVASDSSYHYDALWGTFAILTGLAAIVCTVVWILEPADEYQILKAKIEEPAVYADTMYDDPDWIFVTTTGETLNVSETTFYRYREGDTLKDIPTVPDVHIKLQPGSKINPSKDPK